MGSARFGAVGARVASKAATRLLLRSRVVGKSDQELLSVIREAVGEAQKAIEVAARHLSCSGRDLATTLVCAIATERFAAVGQVGDCSCVLMGGNGEVLTLLPPQKGQYANETHALGGHEEVLKSKVYRGNVHGLALFSDGLERIALDRDRPYWPFLGPTWQFVSGATSGADTALEDLLQSERVRRATDDDCTLVLAVLAPTEEVDHDHA